MSQPLTLLQGDCREVLRTLPDASVHCCVTSPPYWGLRDYGHGDQIGLEPTPQAYVETMRQVFGEVRRVLRDDGTMWLNLGDSYAGAGYSNHENTGGAQREEGGKQRHTTWREGAARADGEVRGDGQVRRNRNGVGLVEGVKAKDLIGIPWRVALALQADGWYLRSDIIWAKSNPMPESVTDRPTRSHEYLFLLAKSARYYYDAGAIAEPVLQSSLVRAEAGVAFGGTKLCPDTRLQSGNEWVPKAEGANSRMNRSHDPAHKREWNGKNRAADDQASGRRMNKSTKEARDNGAPHDNPFGVTRNKRDVWTVPTSPYTDAHFATYPPDIIRPCILAGCPVGGVVLDPFAGSGTTGTVALELGRYAVLIELNPDYVKLCDERCRVTRGLPL